VESNLRFRRWPHLISVEAIPELREFSDGPHHVRIGAALPLQDLEQLWNGAPDTIRNWLRSFASPPIRNRATLGGNLATASPIGDAAPLLLALDASLQLSSSQGDRLVPLRSFFAGYRQTLLQPGELIRSIQIPKPFPQFLRYFKVSKRRADDISTVAAGLSLNWDSAGRISCARFAFGGVAEQPLRMTKLHGDSVGMRALSSRLGVRSNMDCGPSAIIAAPRRTGWLWRKAWSRSFTGSGGKPNRERSRQNRSARKRARACHGRRSVYR